ncbi:hypothetical protein GCM10010284_36730 [Streptomyces rubiginosohelvolus]|uniref:Uncharacterized protein n=1 Tax=Streptomyces rubiginosohelvolus TaxID=67362 RepID=A0ABQ3C6E7_9ACTN|nr:hypothetical protein GCM10010284_36730 [Streptomyces rubiginosohelvolus]GGZ69986.1 hypothetical protein GCM10010328_51440 [Streptomyces pluricolorescens]
MRGAVSAGHGAFVEETVRAGGPVYVSAWLRAAIGRGSAHARAGSFQGLRTAQARVSLRGARLSGGPQKARIRHIQRAPGGLIASVARVRLLVVVMGPSKTDVRSP